MHLISHVLFFLLSFALVLSADPFEEDLSRLVSAIESGDSDSVEALRTDLASSRLTLAQTERAVTAIGAELLDESVVLDDRDPLWIVAFLNSRTTAVQILEDLGAYEAISKLLGSKHWLVRTCAGEMLARAGPTNLPLIFGELERGGPERIESATHAFHQMGPPCLPALEARLWDENLAVRAATQGALRSPSFAPADSTRLLRAVLEREPSDELRAAAVLALGERYQNGITAILVAALEEPQGPETRKQLAFHLGLRRDARGAALSAIGATYREATSEAELRICERALDLLGRRAREAGDLRWWFPLEVYADLLGLVAALLLGWCVAARLIAGRRLRPGLRLAGAILASSVPALGLGVTTWFLVSRPWSSSFLPDYYDLSLELFWAPPALVGAVLGWFCWRFVSPPAPESGLQPPLPETAAPSPTD